MSSKLLLMHAQSVQMAHALTHTLISNFMTTLLPDYGTGGPLLPPDRGGGR